MMHDRATDLPANRAVQFEIYYRNLGDATAAKFGGRVELAVSVS